MTKLFMHLAVLMLAFYASFVQAADIQIGPGDILKISVYDHPELTMETRVSEEGNITFPFLSEVKLAGLTTSAAEKRISKLLMDGDYLRKPQINITILRFESHLVSVLGQVLKQGRYPIEGKRSLTDMLAMAGGISPDGGDTAILIRSSANGKSSREVIDVLDMIQSGDLNKNTDLKAGDLIYVERAPKFYIYGEVQRPGVFRLERDMTVVQALSVGGGLTARGTERGVRIQRRDASGKLHVIKAKPSDMVKEDDVISIQESLF
ncbi:MAG: polysaccharide export protein EpsE [Gallionellaceae bacterium]|nr:polysaccharide export protein EpsE [Gallionellaceae bacterium]